MILELNVKLNNYSIEMMSKNMKEDFEKLQAELDSKNLQVNELEMRLKNKIESE